MPKSTQTSPSSAPASPAWRAPGPWLQAGHQRDRARAGQRRRRPDGELRNTLRHLRPRRAVLHGARPAFRKGAGARPAMCKPWSANAVRVLDPHGRVAEAALPAREPHWVGVPGMDALARQWAQPLVDGRLRRNAKRGSPASSATRSMPDAGSCRPAARRIRCMSTPASTRCCWPCRSAQACGFAARSGDGAAARANRWTSVRSRSLLDTDAGVPAGRAAHAASPRAAVERRAQHASPHRLAGARIVQAGPRPDRALDGAGQRRMVAGTPR